MKLALPFAFFAASTFAFPAMSTTLGPYYIFFDPGGHKLSKFAPPILDAVVTVSETYPDGHFLVVGHVDAAEAIERNDGLSCARALVVRSYLLSRGVAAERMTAISYGGNRPLVRTPEGVSEAQNRLVEVQLTLSAEVADATAGAGRC